MRRALRIDGAGWFAILALNIVHYAILALLGTIALLLVLLFLTHDADHLRIRARIDHIIEVWTADRGVAERRQSSASCLVGGSQ